MPASRESLQTSDGSALERGASPERPIVLFDGVCNLCNRSVNFIIDRDQQGVFRFASQQSAAGRELLARCGLPADELSTMVLIEGERHYTRSSAALRIARRLRFPWRLLFGLIVIPPPLRNLGYRLIAHNRYRWFGKTESCRVPTPDLRERFLDELPGKDSNLE
jgi:predicted DCC family thiol-disulfide oxidoreductase YuxK